jgi:enoyl-CoA hydratase/carnithine racemase
MESLADGGALYGESGGVARLVFDRPEARNALTLAMYDALGEVCRAIRPGGGVRVLILEGAGGRAFAAGTDMAAFRDFATAGDAHAYEARIEGVLSALEACPVPVIAALTGACTGGGAAIACTADIRIADSRLKFGFPIARTLGNALSVSTLDRVGRVTGFARLREILMTARLVEAEEAHRIGLVSEVLPDPQAVAARAAALAGTLAGHAPITLRATKEALRRLRIEGPGAADGDLIAEAYTSADFREGMEAFLAKRPPRFEGR